ncbi:4CL1 ligase, partial [Acromyrmex heyeri]
MVAASAGYIDIVSCLITHGADVNARSASYNTYLIYGCAGEHEEIVRILLDSGADVEDHNEDGHTPLMVAASAGHVEEVACKYCVVADSSQKADVNAQSTSDDTTLIYGCADGYEEVVRVLLDSSVDVEDHNENGHTPLMEAASIRRARSAGHLHVAKVLLEHKNDNTRSNKFEKTAFIAASINGHMKVANKNLVNLAQLLIERGANIEDVNDDGYTPLMQAALENNEEMVALLEDLVQYLLESGADVHPEYLDARSGDKILMLLPFYHGYGIGMMMIGLISRCTMIIMSTFEPKLFLTLIQKYKVTHVPVVPPILTFLAKHPLVDRYDFRSVRELVCGAAPLGKDIVTAVKTRLGIKYIRNGYGMTELSIVNSVSGRNDDNDDSFENPGTGLLVPGFLSKVVDLETQETLEAGQVGEICCMGEQVMLGYWNNPEATKQTIDQDGWLHTGDIGYFDNKNRLHVIDRVKELIKYKGYQVAPSEIETVLLSHQAIKDAAVTSRPDERNGEISMAFIVKQPDATITAQDVQEFIKQKLSEQKWLHGGVQFVDAIPKNPSGKILRRELRTMISKF